MPEERRGNGWAQSNWVENPKPAQEDKSRSDSINEIERACDIYAVVDLMQISGDPKFAWDLLPLTANKQTIEIREPPGSETADEASHWAEIALNFIQASLRYGSFKGLQKIPPKRQSPRWFLEQAQDLRRAIQPPNAAMTPIYSCPQMLKGGRGTR